MIKKSLLRKINLLFLTLFMFFPIMVWADNVNCKISLGKNSKNTITRGEIVTIDLGFDDEIKNGYINEINYSITYDRNIFELAKQNDHIVKTDWNIVKEDVDTTSSMNLLLITINTDDQNKMVKANGNTSYKSIGTISFIVRSTSSPLLDKDRSTNISLENTSSYKAYIDTISDENQKVIGCSHNNINLYIKSDNSLLTNIKVDGVSLDNCFKDNNYSSNCTYEVDSAKDKVNIEAIKSDDKAKVSGDIGTKTLHYGINPFNIQVISESGRGRTYTLYVNRPDNRSKVNTLKTLSLSKGKINFNPMVTEYDLTVENNVEEITITSSLMDNKAKYVEDYSNKKISLYEGNNKVSITIIAENGDENTYTLNINRALSGNNILSELIVNNEKINLNKNDFSYKYTVENSVTKVDIVANTSDDEATVEIENVDSLEVGENEIGIYVTAANGDAVRYNLYVTRKPLLSNNTNLKSISIHNYKFDFQKDKFYYDLKIKDEEALDIEVITEDEKTQVTIEGNKNLINGSVIKITAKAENGDNAHYFINIEKKKAFNLLWIILILMLLIIFGTIIIIILMKDKDRRNSLRKVEEKKKEIEEQEEIKQETVKEKKEDSNLDTSNSKEKKEDK